MKSASQYLGIMDKGKHLCWGHTRVWKGFVIQQADAQLSKMLVVFRSGCTYLSFYLPNAVLAKILCYTKIMVISL